MIYFKQNGGGGSDGRWKGWNGGSELLLQFGGPGFMTRRYVSENLKEVRDLANRRRVFSREGVNECKWYTL